MHTRRDAIEWSIDLALALAIIARIVYAIQF